MKIVNRYNIALTEVQVYRVFEEYDGHSIMTSEVCGHVGPNHKFWGDVSSRKLPAILDALAPYTKKRSDKVREWLDACYAEAYAAIYKAFPHLMGIAHKKSMGDIETFGEKYDTREEAIILPNG